MGPVSNKRLIRFWNFGLGRIESVSLDAFVHPNGKIKNISQNFIGEFNGILNDNLLF